MIYPNADKLDAMESKYALVIVAAKRSRQIKDGARRLVESQSKNPLTIALEEIAEGKIIPVQVGEIEAPKPSEPPTPVLGGLVATTLEKPALREPTAAEIGALLTPEDEELMEEDELATEEEELEELEEEEAEEETFDLGLDEEEEDEVEDDSTSFLDEVDVDTD
jgi:DNA-directed RNA polymerase subunit omega